MSTKKIKESNEAILPVDKKKAYSQMMRKYKKLLKNDAKEAAPWDWSFGLNMLIDFLKWMQEYYELGYNVWALDVTDPNEPIYTEKTRAESLKETIYWYNRWMNADEDYIKIVDTEEDVQHYLELGFHLRKDVENSEVAALKSCSGHYLTLYEDPHKNTEELIKATKEYKKKFFECLEKYLEQWWD